LKLVLRGEDRLIQANHAILVVCGPHQASQLVWSLFYRLFNSTSSIFLSESKAWLRSFDIGNVTHLGVGCFFGNSICQARGVALWLPTT